MEEVYQVLVKFLDGKHRTLSFASPSISALSVKTRIHEIAPIPVNHQRLLANGRQLEDSHLFHADGARLFPTVHLLLRLRGGKGGFGSLLRGAATKAGQKKTNNFDACRDMSGRRLRHVNAEKKLEEWRAGAEERRLEKIAEDFIKRKAKAVRKGGSSGDAEKYVEKYKEDSAKCMEEVDKSVREAIGGFVNSKRKVSGANGSESKRLKIWAGKRILNESDSDATDDDDSDEDEWEIEKSAVSDNGNVSDSSKEAAGSSGSVTGGKVDGESSDGGSSESDPGEEKETVVKLSLESGESPDGGAVQSEENPVIDIHEERMVRNKDASCLEASVVSETEAVQAEKQVSNKTETGNMEEIVNQPPSISSIGDGEASDMEVNGNSKSERVVQEEPVCTSTNGLDLEKPLNFDEFSSAAELEVLGMERLKSELQMRGLKCGGTLQERSARLFLLKTTPLELLPKKLLAKK